MTQTRGYEMSKQVGKLTLYTVEELAAVLDVQERTIREYLREGKLHGRKLANRWYITDEAVADYFRQREGAPLEGLEEEPER